MELSISIACLFPFIESGALAAISAATASEVLSTSSSSTTSVTRPIRSARSASRLRPVRKSSLVRGHADRVDEPLQPGVAVDQAELRRGHAELGPARADPQVAGQGQLEASAQRVPVDRGDHRPGVGGDRVERGLKGMCDQGLRVALERLRRGSRRCHTRPRTPCPSPRSPRTEPRSRDRGSASPRRSRRAARGRGRCASRGGSASDARPPPPAHREASFPPASSSAIPAGVLPIRGRRGRRPRRRTGPPRSESR